MKAIFVSYNQAYYSEVVDLLNENGCRGYTMWEDIAGVGSTDGEPHLGSHAWPTMNNAILAMVEDDKVAGILEDVKAADGNSPQLGMRAFVWNVEQSV
ncbi:MAG: hypothetical protein HUJ94_04590 [Bacteroidales bacterium]|nr:hypothetical protein [Bacteroidales bacterium]